MAAPLPWCPWTFQDWWLDTDHLSHAAARAYLNLLGYYWLRGGPLPDDSAALCQLSKIGTRQWQLAEPKVRAFFRPENGLLRHKRMDKDLAEAFGTAGKRSAASQVANDARWSAQRIRSGVRNGVRVASAEDPQSQSHKNPDDSSSGLGARAPAEIKKPSARQGTRMTQAMELSDEWRGLAAEHAPGCDVERVFAEFKDFWLAAGGRYSAKRDWTATWRNRLRQVADQGGRHGRGSNRGGQLAGKARVYAELAEALEREQGQAADAAYPHKAGS